MLGSAEGVAEAELPVLPTDFTGGAFAGSAFGGGAFIRSPEGPRVRFTTGTGGGGAFVRFPEGPKVELAGVSAARGLLFACGV